MIALLRRLRVEMNGAVTGAMENGGIKYGLNYGVSIPAIKDIAGEYGTNHSLALFLFEQDVRELRLAALFIDDPKQVNPQQMRKWSANFTNPEIVEQGSMRLFSKSLCAYEIALEWLGDVNPLIRYAGFLTASGFAALESPAIQINELIEAASESLKLYDADRLIVTGATAFLRNAAKISDKFKNKVKNLSEELSASDDIMKKHIGTEVGWLIEE